MGDTPAPGADKKPEVSPAPAAAPKAEVQSEDVETLKARLDAAEKARAVAERKLESAARKGKSADELQDALEKREEELGEAKREHEQAVAKRDKLVTQLLKPRLEALPEQVRELVKRAGKESPEALVEALELAEKAHGRQVQPVQGGPVQNVKQESLEDKDGNFDIYGGFGRIAQKAAKP